MSVRDGNGEIVLFVSPCPGDHVILQQIFASSNWQLEAALTAVDALAIVDGNPGGTAAVICDHQLPPHDWRWLLFQLGRLPAPPNLIVCSRIADDLLWAEVLNLGAFDLLLAEPFDPEEVLRVTASAIRMRPLNAISAIPLCAAHGASGVQTTATRS